MTPIATAARKRGEWVLLALTSLAAPLFLRLPGTVDMSIWLDWLGFLRQHSLVDAYRLAAPDYPPLSFVLLWLVDRAGSALGLSAFAALKLSLLLALWLTSALVLVWTRRPALAALAQLALVLNAVAHGYLDVYGAPFLLMSLWALQSGRPRSFAAWLALSALTKWQPLIAAPFLLPCALSLFPERTPMLRRWLALALAGLTPLVVLLCVFDLEPVRAFGRTLQHPMLSANALNFDWLYTWMLHLVAPRRFGRLAAGRVFIIETRDFAILLLPRLLFLASYLVALARTWRRPSARTLEGALPCATLGYLAYFMFNPGVHENHLYLVTVLALASAWLAPHAWPLLRVWIVFANLNLLLFYGLDGTGPHVSRVYGVDLSVPLAALGLALFAWQYWYFLLRRSDAPGSSRLSRTPQASP